MITNNKQGPQHLRNSEHSLFMLLTAVNHSGMMLRRVRMAKVVGGPASEDFAVARIGEP